MYSALVLLYLALCTSALRVVVSTDDVSAKAGCDLVSSHLIGGATAFLYTDDCLAGSDSFGLRADEELVAIRQAGVEDALSTTDWHDLLVRPLESAQMPFGMQSQPRLLIRAASDVHLYAVPRDQLAQADLFFPINAQLYTMSVQENVVPVPPEADEALRKYLPMQFDKYINKYLEAITADELESTVRYLSGEDEKSPLRTRHAFTEDAVRAAHWLKGNYETAGFACELQYFQQGFSPNVVCLWPQYRGANRSDEIVVVGAHYDSRGSFGRVRSGGADDDASGSAALLSIARAMRKNKLSFDRQVMLVAFSGEEQGLVGSKALAKSLKHHNRNVVLMIQMDMLAYRVPSEPMQFAVANIGSLAAMDLLRNASQVYTPQSVPGITPACCSDHQSFFEQGYPAVQVFERNDWIADPQYHQSGDLSDRVGYDFEQLRANAQAVFAALMHVAQVTSKL